MNIFHSGWYLIYTKPRQEKKVHTHLAEMQIESFFPTRRTLRTWSDRRRLIDEPLFPSYVFIHLKDMRDYYEGSDADGALYYVRTGKELARVNEAIVKNIKLVTCQAGDIEISYARFQPGHRLVINQGPMTGLSCEVVQCSGKDKLLVRIDLLQRNLLLTLPVEDLTAV